MADQAALYQLMHRADMLSLPPVERAHRKALVAAVAIFLMIAGTFKILAAAAPASQSNVSVAASFAE
jgi:hypothetical protein